MNDPFPVSESLLCYFVASLARQGLAPTTIRTYLPAVRHAQIMRGFPEPRQFPSLPRLRLVQSGVRRERGQNGPPPAQHLPITPSILRQIRAALLAAPPHHDKAMLWAAASACFFGFFRAGEITVPSVSAFDLTVHLAWGDVSIDSGHPPSKIRVFLKRSKTDQFGRGVAVFLGATGDELCPVAAVVSFAALRGDAAGPFFCFQDGTPLTKSRFVARICEAMAQAGIPTENYSDHSFRIGAATTAAQAGLQDSTIQSPGRWSSTAFLSRGLDYQRDVLVNNFTRWTVHIIYNGKIRKQINLSLHLPVRTCRLNFIQLTLQKPTPDPSTWTGTSPFRVLAKGLGMPLMWKVHADPKECEQRELADHERCMLGGSLLGGWSPLPGSTPRPKEWGGSSTPLPPQA